MMSKGIEGTTIMVSGDYTFRVKNDVVDRLLGSPVKPPFMVAWDQKAFECYGDGSKFCCARNGCHPHCDCIA